MPLLTIFALDTLVKLDEAATRALLVGAMSGHTPEEAALIGTFISQGLPAQN